jgi:hypothetical protein
VVRIPSGRRPIALPIGGLVLLRGWWAVASSVAVPDSVSTKDPKASPASAGRRPGTLGSSPAGCLDCLHRESFLSCTSRRNSSGLAQAGAATRLAPAQTATALRRPDGSGSPAVLGLCGLDIAGLF